MTEPFYGQECIADIHDVSVRFDRESIAQFCADLCEAIGMKAEDLFFWDYEGEPEAYKAAPPHLKGISAVQFITTSNITLHSLDELKRIYVNIFSCQPFDPDAVREFLIARTHGRIVTFFVLMRV